MIVAGSANMDVVVRANHAPGPGETLLGQDYAFYPGGKGANQAVAASRAGARVAFLGCIGRDPYGDRLTEALIADHIDLAAIRRVAAPTGIAFITVEASGENRILVVPGANLAFLPAHLPEIFAPGTVLLTQLEIPVQTVLAAAALIRACSGTVILNASPIAAVDAQSRAALLAATDILLVNETEAAMLLGTTAELSALLLRGRGSHAPCQKPPCRRHHFGCCRRRLVCRLRIRSFAQPCHYGRGYHRMRRCFRRRLRQRDRA